MKRPLEETFELVQYLHAELSHSGYFYRVPFHERDKVVANLLGITQHYVSGARLCKGYFSKFRGSADAYFLNRHYLRPGLLAEVVPYFFKQLRTEKKYRNSPPPEIDKAIAKSLGYSETKIRLARVGGGNYRRLRGCVDPDLRFRSRMEPEKRYKLVKTAFKKLLADDELSGIGVKELDKIVAAQQKINAGTVQSIRCGCGKWKRFGGMPIVNKRRLRFHQKL